jgi:hypothetical protein
MGATLAGAASGAKLGSTFGVVGGIIGGIGGAVLGFFNKSKQLKKELSEMKKSFADSFGGMDALKMKAGEAGIALDDMFKAKSKDALSKAIDDIKLKLETFDEANNALNEAIDKYGITIDELGPKFAQQKLDEQAASLLKDWQLLSAAGVDINTLIGKMGPNLNEYVQTSIKAGASIPMAMKPMVDQLIASGQLLDENGVAFSSAEAAGITFAETLTEGLTRAVDAIEKLVAALTGMPTSTSPINIPVNYDYGSGGGSPSYGDPLYGGFSPVPMDTGGVATRPTYALVGERGPEAVMPLEDLREMMKSGGQGTIINSVTHVNISDNPFQTFETAEQAKRRILEIVREEEQQATAKLIVGRNA